MQNRISGLSRTTGDTPYLELVETKLPIHVRPRSLARSGVRTGPELFDGGPTVTRQVHD